MIPSPACPTRTRLPGMSRHCCLAVLLIWCANAVNALDIVVTNDDGFESALSHALYQRLKSAGHRVMIAASVQDQSGQGSATLGMRPLLTLERDSRAGQIKRGAPALGSLPSDANIHYVDGTPGMAVIYAIDHLAPTQWKKRPDLVISGPNYGNNLASGAVGSGTIGAALFAVNRTVPAMAVSSGHSFRYRDFTQLKPGDIDHEIGDIVVRLVTQLDKTAQRKHDTLLPPGIGLNVNIPAFSPGSGTTIPFRLTRLGHQIGIYFSTDLSQDPNAQRFGLSLPSAPGFSWGMENVPAELHLPVDTDPRAEVVAIRRNVVTISAMQGIPQADAADERAVWARIRGLPNARR
jgi:5'-nucleotidase